jgi:hypothetical protein
MCLESGRRNRATYTTRRDDRYEGPGSRSLQGVSQQARLHESAHSVLLSVAVFAGLSGRTNRFDLFLVHQLASLAHSLSCPPSGFVSYFSRRETS